MLNMSHLATSTSRVLFNGQNFSTKAEMTEAFHHRKFPKKRLNYEESSTKITLVFSNYRKLANSYIH